MDVVCINFLFYRIQRRKNDREKFKSILDDGTKLTNRKNDENIGNYKTSKTIGLH